MNQIGADVEVWDCARDHEIATLTVAVSAIDDILPRIDVARLFINEQYAVALVRAGADQGELNHALRPDEPKSTPARWRHRPHPRRPWRQYARKRPSTVVALLTPTLAV